MAKLDTTSTALSTRASSAIRARPIRKARVRSDETPSSAGPRWRSSLPNSVRVTAMASVGDGLADQRHEDVLQRGDADLPAARLQRLQLLELGGPHQQGAGVGLAAVFQDLQPLGQRGLGA